MQIKNTSGMCWICFNRHFLHHNLSVSLQNPRKKSSRATIAPITFVRIVGKFACTVFYENSPINNFRSYVYQFLLGSHNFRISGDDPYYLQLEAERVRVSNISREQKWRKTMTLLARHVETRNMHTSHKSMPFLRVKQVRSHPGFPN